MYISVDELHRALVGVLSIDADGVHIIDEKMLRASVIDALVFTAVFAPEADLGARSRSLIRRAANALGIRCASLRTYYLAVGRGEAPTTATVPAINMRTLTYNVARTLVKLKTEPRTTRMNGRRTGTENSSYTGTERRHSVRLSDSSGVSARTRRPRSWTHSSSSSDSYSRC